MDWQQREQQARPIILSTLVVLCIALTIVASVYGQDDAVYTQLFYIPILVAAIWYQRKAIVLAALLGILHMSADFAVKGYFDPATLLRAATFVFAAALAVWLTEQKEEINRRLRRSNSELANVIEFYPDATLVVDNAGRVVAWNRAMVEMTGVPAADMIGRGDMEYAMPFYGGRTPMLIDLVGRPEDELRAKYSDVTVRNGRLEAVSTSARIAGNDAPVLHGTASKLYDADGRPIGAIESVRDITDRKRAELALRESEGKLRVVTETAPVAICILQDGRFKYANPAMETISGYSRSELLDLNFMELVHPDARKYVEGRYGEWLSGSSGEFRSHLMGVRKDGKACWIDLSRKTIEFEGRPALLLSGIDVTERKQAEAALRESEEKFRVVTETSPMSVCVYRGDRFLYVNRAIEEYTEYSRDELLQMSILDIIHPDYKDMIARFSRARQRGEQVPSRYEVEFRTKSGKERWAILAAELIAFNGHPSVLVAATDITEIKAAGQALKASEEALSYKNKELSMISGIVGLINRSDSLEEVLEGTLSGTLELLGMDAGVIYLAEAADPSQLALRAFVPRTEAGLDMEPRKAIRSDPALNVGRVCCCADGGTAPFAEIFVGRTATVVVPILLKGSAIGLMAFGSAADEVRRELPDLLSIGSQLGIAIDNHTLLRTLRATTSYMGEIINESPDAIVTVDAGGNVISANKRVAHLLLYDPGELAGMNVRQLLPPGAAGLSLAGERSYVRDFMRKDGVVVPLNISTASFESETAPDSYIIALKDLSEIDGLKIVPTVENAIEGARRYHFEKGYIYLLDRGQASDGMDIFADQVKHNVQGLCITRQNPQKIRERFGLEKTPIVWLNGSDLPTGEGCIKPDNLTGLGKTVYKFLAEAGDGVVLLDGVEYLVARNSFDSMLKFLHLLNDRVMISHSSVLVSLDPLALEVRQYHVLKAELRAFDGH